jgi:hypothetical protein
VGTGAQDYVIPGIAVDKSTSGGSAHLVVTFYYQSATCNSISSCMLNVGSVSSTNGGSSWGAATVITASGIPQGWLATTSQGRMVGDYISTSFNGSGSAFGVFMTATTPTSGTNCSDVPDNCNEPTDTTASGLALGGSILPVVGKAGNSNNGVDWVLAASTGLLHAH